jgi:hypothetical protein
MLRPSDFFDLGDPFVASFFEGCDYAWQAVGQLATHVSRRTGSGQTIAGEVMAGAFIGEQPIWIEAGARVEGRPTLARGRWCATARWCVKT